MPGHKSQHLFAVTAFIAKRYLTRFCLSSLSVFILVASLSEAAEPERDLRADLKKLSIEELLEVEVATVYGASKYEQKITEAPSSVTIITADQIKKYGYRTLADILKSVRGFYVSNDRNYSYVGVRGFARPGDFNSRILVLVDGHRINDNVYDSVLIGLEFILDIDLIDRVEVIRGPSSSLYGDSAFFAVINILTKGGPDFQGPEVSGAASGFNTYGGRLSYGNKFSNGTDVIFSGSLLDSKGQNLFFKEFDSPDTNNGVARSCDYERNYNLFSKLAFHGLTLEGAYVSRTKGIPTASFGTIFGDPRNRTVDEQGYADLSYKQNVGKLSEVQARIYYDRSYYHGDYVYGPQPVITNKDISWGAWWGGELRIVSAFFERHKLTVGTDYRYNSRQDQKNYDVAPFFVFLNDKRHSAVWAAYVQDEFSILKDLIINAGVRYDHYDTFGGTTNPRLALIYNPLPKTFLKLIYGEAFRAPNAFELYYQDGGISSKSNPRLDPETIKTYELVLEQYLGSNLYLTASGFYYRIRNLISQQTDPADGLIVFRNVERVEAKGMELEIDNKWDNGVEGRVSYTYQDTKNQQTGEILTNSPRHLVKFNMIVPFVKEKLFLGIEEQYMSQRRTLANKETGAFFITNLTLFSQRLMKGVEVSGSIYNLFDEKYGDPGAEEHREDTIRQDGRNFRFKLTYKF